MVQVGGAMCGAKLFTPQYSTTTMRYHLNAKHPEVYKKVVTFETDHDAAKSKARKDLTKFFYSVEKKSPKKRLADADETMPGTPGPGTPAANMLAAIPALTNEIQIGLGCVDHLFNLVVNKALSEDPEIRQALDSFKALTSKTHKSSLCYQRIRRECEKMNKDESIPDSGNTY